MYTLRDWAVDYAAKGQETIIADLEKASGLFATMPFSAASHNGYHRYILAENLPTGGFRALNGSIVPNTATKKILQEDLHEYYDVDSVDPSYVKDLGISAAEAFAKNSPQFLMGAAQKLTTQFFYGITGDGDADGWVGLRELAIANGNNQSMGGEEGSSTTMFVVRWEPGVMEGLFDPEFLATGQLINMMLINEGKVVHRVTDTTTGALKPVIEAAYQSKLGLLKAGANNVAVITNIQDATGDKPTVTAIDKAIEQVNGYSQSGLTYIYCNSRCYRLTGELKDSKLTSMANDSMYRGRLDTWDGLFRIVVDDNITNTEDYS